jgi:hypothetical protein
MRWLFLFILAACSTTPSYRTKHVEVGTGGGFMHLEKREGISYYYRFEELGNKLKLNLMLVNTTPKPYKIFAEDFSLLVNDQEVKPVSKWHWLKDAEARAQNLSGHELKELGHEISLVDRFMLDKEIQLVPDSPTKSYVLFAHPQEKKFQLKLGPRSTPIEVEKK